MQSVASLLRVLDRPAFSSSLQIILFLPRLISNRIRSKCPKNSRIAIHLMQLSLELIKKVKAVGSPLGHESDLHTLNMKQQSEGLIIQIIINRNWVRFPLLGWKWTKQQKISNYNNMLNWLKPAGYRKANSVLHQFGFYARDFRAFQIQLLAEQFAYHHTFLFEIFKEITITPEIALKVVLLCQQAIRTSKQTHFQQSIFEFLQRLSRRIHTSVREQVVDRQKDNIDTLSTSVEIINNQEELVAMDFASIILSKIVVPLINFQLKILVEFEVVNGSSYESQQECWARINLLRRIVEIGCDIQSLGRYYFKESQFVVVSLMKVLNIDIQNLYKKIFAFCRKKIAFIQVILDEKGHSSELLKQQRIEEFLMIIEELQVVNQKLRMLYNGRYFVFLLAKVNVYLPILFTGDEHIELLYKMRRVEQRKSRSVHKSRSHHQLVEESVQYV